MAKFLTTVGNSYSIEEIIINSIHTLTFVTPYLKLSNNLIERINDADKRGVNITLIYGKSELKKSEKENLNKLKNIKVYYYQNLHAKCYFNESNMIITSMNLYEFSERNNREMGILINKEKDTTIYNDGLREVESIINTSEQDKSFSNPQQRIVCKLDSKYLGEYNFHLPALQNIINEVYHTYESKLHREYDDFSGRNVDWIEITNFPYAGITLKVEGFVISLYFDDKKEYANVKQLISSNISDELSENRIYWNYLKLQIYPTKGYNFEVSELELKNIITRFPKLIETVYKEIKTKCQQCV